MARNNSTAKKAKVVESKVDSKPEVKKQEVPTTEEKKEEVPPTPDTKDLDAELKNLEVKPTEEELKQKLDEEIDVTTKSEKVGEEIDMTALDGGVNLAEEVDPDPILNWKKIGGGSFELKGRYIKPNEKFQARASEIPKVFRDVVSLLDSIQPGQPVTKHIAVVYTLEPLEGGLFNVIDSYKKKINEEPLDKDTALSFISSLNS